MWSLSLIHIWEDEKAVLEESKDAKVKLEKARLDLEQAQNEACLLYTSQHGQLFRLKGKGVKSSRGQGDQYVEVQLEVPTKLNRDEKELFEKIRDKRKHESPFEKFKKAFKMCIRDSCKWALKKAFFVLYGNYVVIELRLEPWELLLGKTIK